MLATTSGRQQSNLALALALSTWTRRRRWPQRDDDDTDFSMQCPCDCWRQRSPPSITSLTCHTDPRRPIPLPSYLAC